MWHLENSVLTDMMMTNKPAYLNGNSLAFWASSFLKQSVGDSSHRWTAYLRRSDNEDISHIVKKVFLLLSQGFTILRSFPLARDK